MAIKQKTSSKNIVTNQVVTIEKFLSLLNTAIAPYTINIYMLQGLLDEIDKSKKEEEPTLIFDDFNQNEDLEIPAYLRKGPETLPTQVQNNRLYRRDAGELLDDFINSDELFEIMEKLPFFLRKFYSEFASEMKEKADIGADRSGHALEAIFNYPPSSLEESLSYLLNLFKEQKEMLESDGLAAVFNFIEERYRIKETRHLGFSRMRFEPYSKKVRDMLFRKRGYIVDAAKRNDFDQFKSALYSKNLDTSPDRYKNIFHLIHTKLKILEIIKNKLHELLYEFESPSSIPNSESKVMSDIKDNNIIIDRFPLGNFPKLVSSFSFSSEHRKKIDRPPGMSDVEHERLLKEGYDIESRSGKNIHYEVPDSSLDDKKILNILSRHFLHYNKDFSKFKKNDSYKSIPNQKKYFSADDEFDKITHSENQRSGYAPSTVFDYEPDLMEYYKIIKRWIPAIYPLHYSTNQKDYYMIEMAQEPYGASEVSFKDYEANKTILMGNNKNSNTSSLLELLDDLFGHLGVHLDSLQYSDSGVTDSNLSNPDHKEELSKYIKRVDEMAEKTILSTNNEVFLHNYGSIERTLSSTHPSDFGYLNEIFTIYVQIYNWYDTFFSRLLHECNSSELNFLNREELSIFDKTSKDANKILFLDIDEKIDYLLEKYPFPDNTKLDYKDMGRLIEFGPHPSRIKKMIRYAMPIRSNILPLFSLFEWNTEKNLTPTIGDYVVFNDNKFGKIIDRKDETILSHSETFIIEMSNSNPTDSHKDKYYRAIGLSGEAHSIVDEDQKSKPKYNFYDDKYGDISIYKKYSIASRENPLRLNRTNMNVFKNECLYNFWNNKPSYEVLSVISKKIHRQADKLIFNFSYKKGDPEKRSSDQMSKVLKDTMHTAKNKITTIRDQNHIIGNIINEQKKNIENSRQFFRDTDDMLEFILSEIRIYGDEVLLDKFETILEEGVDNIAKREDNYNYDQKALVSDLTAKREKIDTILDDLMDYFSKLMGYYTEANLKMRTIKDIKEEFDTHIKLQSFASNDIYCTLNFHENLSTITDKNLNQEFLVDLDKLGAAMENLLNNSKVHSFDINDEDLWDNGEDKKIDINIGLFHSEKSIDNIDDLQSIIDQYDKDSDAIPNNLFIEYYNSGTEIKTTEGEYWEKDSTYGKNKGNGIGTANVKKVIEEFHGGNTYLDLNQKEGHRVYLTIPLKINDVEQ